MIGKSAESVKLHFRAIDTVEKAYGASKPEVEHRPRPLPAAHPSTSRYADSSGLPKLVPGRSHERGILRNLEKGSSDTQSLQSHQSSSHQTRTAYAGGHDDFDDEDEDPKRHAVWILIYLSALAPLLALLIALYTILATTLLLLLSPFCICANRWPLTARFYRFLAPPPEFQLGLIFSSYETNCATFHSDGNIAILVLANTFAPIYAIFIALSAWVGGVFWMYTAILGNPDGKEERDDGREAVFAVRGWWEKWLVHGLE